MERIRIVDELNFDRFIVIIKSERDDVEIALQLCVQFAASIQVPGEIGERSRKIKIGFHEKRRFATVST